MERIAYINKENKVVHIAAFGEDKIQKNAKGKLLFGGSSYDAETGKWNHSLGYGEEVFEVDGTGLGVGDIYIKPEPPAPIIEDKKAALLGEKTRSLEELRTRIMIEKANEEAGWQDRVQKLITLRDALIIEINELGG